MISSDVWPVIEVWAEWKVYGVLPDPGDLNDQRHYISEVIKICEAAYNKEQSRQAENTK